MAPGDDNPAVLRAAPHGLSLRNIRARMRNGASDDPLGPVEENALRAVAAGTVAGYRTTKSHFHISPNCPRGQKLTAAVDATATVHDLLGDSTVTACSDCSSALLAHPVIDTLLAVDELRQISADVNELDVADPTDPSDDHVRAFGWDAPLRHRTLTAQVAEVRARAAELRLVDFPYDHVDLCAHQLDKIGRRLSATYSGRRPRGCNWLGIRRVLAAAAAVGHREPGRRAFRRSWASGGIPALKLAATTDDGDLWPAQFYLDVATFLTSGMAPVLVPAAIADAVVTSFTSVRLGSTIYDTGRDASDAESAVAAKLSAAARSYIDRLDTYAKFETHRHHVVLVHGASMGDRLLSAVVAATAVASIQGRHLVTHVCQVDDLELAYLHSTFPPTVEIPVSSWLGDRTIAALTDALARPEVSNWLHHIDESRRLRGSEDGLDVRDAAQQRAALVSLYETIHRALDTPGYSGWS